MYIKFQFFEKKNHKDNENSQDNENQPGNENEGNYRANKYMLKVNNRKNILVSL